MRKSLDMWYGDSPRDADKVEASAEPDANLDTTRPTPGRAFSALLIIQRWQICPYTPSQLPAADSSE